MIDINDIKDGSTVIATTGKEYKIIRPEIKEGAIRATIENENKKRSTFYCPVQALLKEIIKVINA